LPWRKISVCTLTFSKEEILFVPILAWHKSPVLQARILSHYRSFCKSLFTSEYSKACNPAVF
jgi:hypothetical protein